MATNMSQVTTISSILDMVNNELPYEALANVTYLW